MKTLNVLGYSFLALMLALWAFFYSQYPINPSISVLASFAREVLMGGVIGIDYYDTNLPLSILVYVPAVALTMATGMPVYHTSFTYCLLLLLAATFLVYRILKHLPLPQNDRLVLTGLFVLANTILTRESFGERDHITLLGLFPFVLLQYAYLLNRKVPSALQWTILMAGIFAVLLKPHFGIMPTFFLAARLTQQQKIFQFYREPDFIALSAGVILYAAVTFFFFRNFITVILGDVALLYAPMLNAKAMVDGLSILAVPIFWFIVKNRKIEKTRENLSDLFSFCVILSFLGFAAQGKGFYYQSSACGYFCRLPVRLQRLHFFFRHGKNTLFPGLYVVWRNDCFLCARSLSHHPHDTQ